MSNKQYSELVEIVMCNSCSGTGIDNSGYNNTLPCFVCDGTGRRVKITVVKYEHFNSSEKLASLKKANKVMYVGKEIDFVERD